MSGEIQLELDLHFIFEGKKYVVDFKSGFGSNEKGNTNRLLLVASIYKNLSESYKCLLFVRAEENNSYFNTLKNSGIWEAYCGSEAYVKIREYSGYDLKSWIDTNMDWANDFKPETIIFLLGISFYTLQNISYLLEIYSKRIKEIPSFLDYTLYSSFFPKFIMLSIPSYITQSFYPIIWYLFYLNHR